MLACYYLIIDYEQKNHNDNVIILVGICSQTKKSGQNVCPDDWTSLKRLDDHQSSQRGMNVCNNFQGKSIQRGTQNDK